MNNNSYEEEIKNFLKERVFKVEVGIPAGTPVPLHKRKTKDGDKPVKTDLTMNQLARILCFGTEKIPARNFLEVAKKKSGDNWKAIGEQLLNDIITGKREATMALEVLGTIVKEDIKLAIVEKGAYKPNAPITLARKGDHKPPLVDEGYLMNSFQVLKVLEESR